MGQPEESTAAHARHSAIYTFAQIIGEDGDGGDVDSHIATDNSPRESFTATLSSWASFPYSSASTANSGLEDMPTPPRSAGPQYQPQPQPQPQQQQQYRQVQTRLQQQHHHHQSDHSQNQEQGRDPQQQEQPIGFQQRHHHEHRQQQQSDRRQQQHHNRQHQQQRHRSQQQHQEQQEHPHIYSQQRHDPQQQPQVQRPQHQDGHDQNAQSHQYPTPPASQPSPQPFLFSEARARQLEADIDRLGARVAEVEIVNIALVQRLAFLEEGIVRVVREMGDQFCRVERRTDQLVLHAIIDGYEAVLGIYPPSESPISASSSLGTRLRAVRDRLAPYSPYGSLAFSDDDPRSMLAVIPNYEDALEHWLTIHGTRNMPSPADCDCCEHGGA